MDAPSGPTWWEILAGACGAIVPIAFRSGLTPRQVVAMGFVGLACAVFAGPALFDYYHIANPQFRAFLTFMIGMGGMRGAEAALTWWAASAERVLEALSPFLRLGRRTNKVRKERRRNRDRRKQAR